MSTRHYIVATAGHVDHGKSALVKALTGTDPDRLPEEKARGITIDLGFAHLELPATIDGQPVTLSLGLVDVPGHEDFVKNMVAGVGSIDLALFVVAADDGWMPQTEEHLQILTYLGVRRAVVALTKIDLLEGNQVEVEELLRERLAGSPFGTAPIIGTSALTGRGLDALKVALASALAAVPPPRDVGRPRLPVDRAFTLRGIGTVVTGTLSGGSLRRGQSIVVQPSGQATRVRSLHSHNRDVESAQPGTRTAVNLPDVALLDQAADAKGGIARGAVITVPELGGPSLALDVLLEKSARLNPVGAGATAKSGAARPLKDGALVQVHHGSGHWPARVSLLDAPALLPGHRAVAQLRFESPIFALAGDRFIVRDWSEQHTLAGGLVLEADAHRRRFRSAAQRTFLKKRADAVEDAAVFAASQLERDHAMARGALLARTRFGPDEIAAALKHLLDGQQALAAGDWVLDRAWWNGLLQRAAVLIQAEHRAHSDRPGLALNDLRAALTKDLPAPGLFDRLVTDLCAQGFAQTGTAIRSVAHRPALPPQLQAAGAKIRAALAGKPFEPPPRKELAPDAPAQQALRFLVQSGEAIDLSEDTVIGADHFARARDAIVQHLRQARTATVSDLRQLLGTNRRVIVPLLERLDRDGVTRRQGDQRVLK